MNRLLERLLWFGGGFALALVLSVSLNAVRFIPMSVVFGLLCFGCGVLLMQSLALRKLEKQLTESIERWAKWEEEKLKWEHEKRLWEAEKAKWEEGE